MSSQGRAVRPEDLAAIATVSDAQISPDGRAVAFVRTDIDMEADDYRARIWIAGTDGGDPVQLTRGPRKDAAPRWSPDGRLLAFLSDRHTDHGGRAGGSAPWGAGAASQLYLLPLSGGEPRRVTALAHGAGPAVWSPDGAAIAFRAVADAPGEAHGAAAVRPRVVTRAQYKGDGFGYTFDRRHQIFVLTLADGRVTQLTHDDMEHAAPAWSPDGRRLVFVRARAGAGDYSLFDLWSADAQGGDPRQLTREVGRAAGPAWSPDGNWIACFGCDEQEAGFGDPMARIWLVPSAGGPARRLTVGYDRAAVLARPHELTPPPIWSPDGRTVTFLAADAGRVHAVRAAASGGTVEAVVRGDRQIQSLTAAGGRLAFTATDPRTPADLYVSATDGSAERRLTHLNAAWDAEVALPPVEHRRFTSPHGGELGGWITLPMGGRRPAPLLVEIHGGPASYAGPVFPLGLLHTYILAARGWAVLQLNPAGSGSYTKAFAHGIRACWGERDLPEQLAAVDALVADGTADGARLAVSGYSYGGFMTSWTITHTDRFKVAVVGAPVVNLESFYGTSDIGPWFGEWEMRGGLVEHRETYRRLSPINYVDRVTTPTLIVHGEGDDRCPIGQGEELFIGLIAAGRATAEFVRYPGQSHAFRQSGRPSHRIDVVRRVVDWIERHVTADAPRLRADAARLEARRS
ncbi:MAG TPA: S9 family peptidase [bacterium]|nr:S9 family peptidase [bacterium]